MNILSWFKNLCPFSGKNDQACCHESVGSQVALDLSAEDQAILKKTDPQIVVGKIISIAPHTDPKITKVQITQCDLGDGEATQILCGGSNIEPGQVVPIAKVGAKLSEDFEIGTRKIRGETSHGMICALSELGLSAKKEAQGGIWVLPSALEKKLGTSLRELN